MQVSKVRKEKWWVEWVIVFKCIRDILWYFIFISLSLRWRVKKETTECQVRFNMKSSEIQNLNDFFFIGPPGLPGSSLGYGSGKIFLWFIKFYIEASYLNLRHSYGNRHIPEHWDNAKGENLLNFQRDQWRKNLFCFLDVSHKSRWNNCVHSWRGSFACESKQRMAIYCCEFKLLVRLNQKP